MSLFLIRENHPPTREWVVDVLGKHGDVAFRLGCLVTDKKAFDEAELSLREMIGYLFPNGWKYDIERVVSPDRNDSFDPVYFVGSRIRRDVGANEVIHNSDEIPEKYLRVPSAWQYGFTEKSG